MRNLIRFLPGCGPSAPGSATGDSTIEQRESRRWGWARRRSVRALAFTFVPPLGLLVLAMILRVTADIEVGTLTRDRQMFAGAKFYAGAYSTLGLLLWASTATICLFTAALVAGRSGRLALMFASGALLSVLLLVDDMLMLHEVVFPYYLGISEYFVVGAQGVAGLLFVLIFRRELLAGPLLLFVMTGGCFAASLISDEMPPGRAHFLIEDGLKLLGICGWLGFWLQRGAIELSGASNGSASLSAERTQARVAFDGDRRAIRLQGAEASDNDGIPVASMDRETATDGPKRGNGSQQSARIIGSTKS
ncbi:MAG TPA: hypothetical protein VGR35_18730 [Tepidisphaeraceae bacterium]|nr:hypothetical protein [Tepidisphaeraceae bacterium]